MRRPVVTSRMMVVIVPPVRVLPPLPTVAVHITGLVRLAVGVVFPPVILMFVFQAIFPALLVILVVVVGAFVARLVAIAIMIAVVGAITVTITVLIPPFLTLLRDCLAFSGSWGGVNHNAASARQGK